MPQERFAANSISQAEGEHQLVIMIFRDAVPDFPSRSPGAAKAAPRRFPPA